MMSVPDGLRTASYWAAAALAAKATIAMAMALLAARPARGSRAAVRHAVLAAAFGVLLVLPVASVVAPAVRIAVPVAVLNRPAPDPSASAGDPVPDDGLGHAAFKGAAEIPPSGGLAPSVFWMAAWICGAMIAWLPMVVGLWQVRSVRRSSVPWLEGQPVVDGLARDAGIERRVEVLLHEALRGPMTCGVAHPAIVLPTDAPDWEPEELQRALVHELEHVRRFDWATHCAARLVCAMYWFHPLVWMAWHRFSLEAERSCDDAVLGSSEATAYAGQLVGLARRLSMTEKPLVLAMANRADLAARVGAVLDGRQKRGRAGAAAVALACGAAAVLVLAMSPVQMAAAPQTAAGIAQTRAAEFDAVSVKLIAANVRGSHNSEKSDPGRLTMTGTLHRFILRAYGITEAQLTGEPGWFKTDQYSIQAVTSGPASLDQMMLMLRGVLTGRFQLKLRQEDRDLPVYALEVAPGGPKFKALKAGEVPQDEEAPPDVYARSFTSVADLLNALNGVFGGRLTVERPVMDRTHLSGSYNIQFRTAVERQADGFGNNTLQFPSLFHDLQSELGLKLVPDRARLPYFVVERAAAPGPN